MLVIEIFEVRQLHPTQVQELLQICNHHIQDNVRSYLACTTKKSQQT
jgi:hypothetical protein